MKEVSKPKSNKNWKKQVEQPPEILKEGQTVEILNVEFGKVVDRVVYYGVVVRNGNSTGGTHGFYDICVWCPILPEYHDGKVAVINLYRFPVERIRRFEKPEAIDITDLDFTDLEY